MRRCPRHLSSSPPAGSLRSLLDPTIDWVLAGSDDTARLPSTVFPKGPLDTLSPPPAPHLHGECDPPSYVASALRFQQTFSSEHTLQASLDIWFTRAETGATFDRLLELKELLLDDSSRAFELLRRAVQARTSRGSLPTPRLSADARPKTAVGSFPFANHVPAPLATHFCGSERSQARLPLPARVGAHSPSPTWYPSTTPPHSAPWPLLNLKPRKEPKRIRLNSGQRVPWNASRKCHGKKNIDKRSSTCDVVELFCSSSVTARARQRGLTSTLSQVGLGTCWIPKM